MAPGGHYTWLAKGTGFCNFSAAKLVKGHQKQLATTAATWAGPAWEGSWHRGGGQSNGSGARRLSSSLSAQANWGQRRAFCLLSPTESGPRGWQIFPVRQGKQGSEQLSDLPRVTQLAVADTRPTSPVQFLDFHLSVQDPPSRVLVSRWAPREGRFLLVRNPGSWCGDLQTRCQPLALWHHPSWVAASLLLTTVEHGVCGVPSKST